MACSSIKTSTTPFTGAVVPKAADHPIGLFQALRPDCPYSEVGLVSARGSRHHTEGILEALKREARKMGGDAIVGLTEGTVVTGVIPAGTAAVTVRRKTLSGTVIAFRDATCTH